MRILIISDLHLEFSRGEFRGYQPPECDVVVIAGDTHPGVLGVMWMAKTFGSTPVVSCSGNHEYYGKRQIHRHDTKLQDKAAEQNREYGSQIHYLQNSSVVIGGVRFLGGTLWTDFKLQGQEVQAKLAAQSQMNDYQHILMSQGRRITPDFIQREHENTRDFIDDALSEEGFSGPTVVVTHHCPSDKSRDPGYGDDVLNACYASHLDGMMHAYKPQLWVHGHIHTSADYLIDETRVICNPRGYAPDDLNPDFIPNLLVDI
jgi:Icc-related predicted phosphoesterase